MLPLFVVLSKHDFASRSNCFGREDRKKAQALKQERDVVESMTHRKSPLPL